jgi:hypothetical protein
MKPGFVIAMLLVVALLFAASYAGAQTLKKHIVGTWELVSAVNEVDGKKVGDLYGPNPLGQFMFDRNGHFSMFLVARQGRVKFASNNRTAGTPEENKAAVVGFMGEFGTYTINPDSKSITLHIVANSFPNWDGTQQRRDIQFSGDEMNLIVAVASTGTGRAVITVKRIK